MPLLGDCCSAFRAIKERTKKGSLPCIDDTEPHWSSTQTKTMVSSVTCYTVALLANKATADLLAEVESVACGLRKSFFDA